MFSTLARCFLSGTPKLSKIHPLRRACKATLAVAECRAYQEADEAGVPVVEGIHRVEHMRHLTGSAGLEGR